MKDDVGNDQTRTTTTPPPSKTNTIAFAAAITIKAMLNYRIYKHDEREGFEMIEN